MIFLQFTYIDLFLGIKQMNKNPSNFQMLMKNPKLRCCYITLIYLSTYEMHIYLHSA